MRPTLALLALAASLSACERYTEATSPCVGRKNAVQVTRFEQTPLSFTAPAQDIISSFLQLLNALAEGLDFLCYSNHAVENFCTRCVFCSAHNAFSGFFMAEYFIKPIAHAIYNVLIIDTPLLLFIEFCSIYYIPIIQ